MNKLTTVLVCVACYITGSLQSTIPPTTLLPPPPTTEPTTIPTTEPPPPTPPITTEPPPPGVPNEILEEIARCQENMQSCQWTAEELVEKIIETQGADRGDFSGEGNSVGATVDPYEVGDKLEPPLGATDSPGGTPPGSTTTSSGVPLVCLPFGQKVSNPHVRYNINCVSYLSDTTIQHYSHRHNAMLGCFKCRYLCELGGEVSYI